MYSLRTWLLFFLFFNFIIPTITHGASRHVRDELDRYALQRDRITIDRNLRGERHDSFFHLDLALSSGLLDLVGDVKSSTENNQNQAQKTAAIIELLNKNINTEKYVDADLEVGIPLPTYSIKNYRLMPSLFYNLNFGLSLSFSNFGNVTNPLVRTYIKKDLKYGIQHDVRINSQDTITVALYKLDRADLLTSVTATQVVQDQKLFNFDTLNQSHIMYSSNWAFKRDDNSRYWLFEIQELQLLSGTSTRKSYYGTRPLLKAEYGKTLKGANHQWKLFGGDHFRKRYNIDQGLYAGAEVSWPDRIPLIGLFKISSDYLTLSPMLKSRYFRFTYTYKTPFRNPQEGIWVPAMYNILIDFNYPF